MTCQNCARSIERTLVATPGYESGGYMRGEGYCQFDPTTVASIDVTVSQETDIGTSIETIAKRASFAAQDTNDH